MAVGGSKKLERYLALTPPPELEEGAFLSDIAYVRLLDAFRDGGFEPGDNLSTNRISQLMGISRTATTHACEDWPKKESFESFLGTLSWSQLLPFKKR